MSEQFSTDNIKEWVKYLFTKEGKTHKEIHLMTGVTESDLRNWVSTGNWDGMRKTQLTSKEHQLNQLYELLDNINKKMLDAEEINSKDADLAVKYTNAIKNLDIEIGVPEIVEVAKLFTSWLRKKDKELTTKVANHFDTFIKLRLKPFVAGV